jgi:translation initiation factor IF-3
MSEKIWKVNNQIRSRFVCVIDDDGRKIGSMILDSAISYARNKGMDLIQVSEDSSSEVVCKIADYGKMKYQSQKNKKSNTSASLKTKEIFISMTISDHDLNVKLNKIREFMDKKHNVIFGVKLRSYKERNSLDKARQKMTECLNHLGVSQEELKYHISHDRISVIFR